LFLQDAGNSVLKVQLTKKNPVAGALDKIIGEVVIKGLCFLFCFFFFCTEITNSERHGSWCSLLSLVRTWSEGEGPRQEVQAETQGFCLVFGVLFLIFFS
jgi:hypothetical protein